MNKLVILGAGQGLSEVLPIICRMQNAGSNFHVYGVLDDNPELWGKEVEGLTVTGPISGWASLGEEFQFVLAIGNHKDVESRFKIISENHIPVSRFVNIIDPTAVILVTTESIGLGLIIHPGVVVYPRTRIGDFVVITANTVIGLDNVLESYSLLASSVCTTSGVRVGTLAFIGAGAKIAPNVQIGELSMVGIGAVVIGNVLPGESVFGNPARKFSIREIPEAILVEYKDTN